MDDRTSQDWVVTFTFDATPEESALHAVEDALTDAAVDASVAATPRDRQVTITLYLPGEDPGDAVDYGSKTLFAHGVLDVIGGRLVAVEAMTEAEHERRADMPTLPELMGASEVGRMLGVSRQRVHQLREHPAFPAPLVEVAMGPLWDARAVEAFARSWSRRPGRPPLAVAE